jgi:(heptosyl)LPS beta-1,4-glucosyltransferase
MSKNNKLSVVLATKNEEKNIKDCLLSVKEIADEMIVFDEYSTDSTRKIAKDIGAKVYKYQHKRNFHETKQKALEKASSEWILQLDADERVSRDLADEIERVVNLKNNKLLKWKVKDKKKRKLFKRHQDLIEKREGKLEKKTGEVVAFFVARKNFFLGKPLIHAGVYPDGVIRLVKKNKAFFPAKTVHELMQIDGEVRWLENDLLHYESPTISRYLTRANRYTTLHAKSLKEKKVPKNIFYLFWYSTYKPLVTFLNLYIRHKGFLDGVRGLLWAKFSAMHFPVAYWKYWTKIK